MCFCHKEISIGLQFLLLQDLASDSCVFLNPPLLDGPPFAHALGRLERLPSRLLFPRFLLARPIYLHSSSSASLFSFTKSTHFSSSWSYIKDKDLQNPSNKREILCDDSLKAVFGKDSVSMFEMMKLMSKHITKL